MKWRSGKFELRIGRRQRVRKEQNGLVPLACEDSIIHTQTVSTVKILSCRTEMSIQTMETKIRLLPRSD